MEQINPNGQFSRRLFQTITKSSDARHAMLEKRCRLSPAKTVRDRLPDVTFEWDLQNAGANLRKHRVTFEEPASVFLNPSATTFPDPDHSSDECREIAIGSTMKGRLVFVSHCERPGGPGSSARVSLLAPVVNNMKKDKASKHPDDLRPEYDLSLLKGAVRGKYHNRAASPTNLVLIDADLANLFPDAEA